MQAIADVTDLPVDCVAVPEGGALGSAWLARIAAGLEEPMAMTEGRRWARVGRRLEPRAGVDARRRGTRYERVPRAQLTGGRVTTSPGKTRFGSPDASVAAVPFAHRAPSTARSRCRRRRPVAVRWWSASRRAASSQRLSPGATTTDRRATGAVGARRDAAAAARRRGAGGGSGRGRGGRGRERRQAVAAAVAHERQSVGGPVGARSAGGRGREDRAA